MITDGRFFELPRGANGESLAEQEHLVREQARNGKHFQNSRRKFFRQATTEPPPWIIAAGVEVGLQITRCIHRAFSVVPGPRLHGQRRWTTLPQ